jgi:hypothetical protein
VRAKRTLVPPGAKAGRDEKVTSGNADNERVLQELVFRADTVKPAF